MNILLKYRYCDAARFCNEGEVVFANPTVLSPAELMQRLAESTHASKITREMGLDAILFDPAALGMPELYFEDSSANDLDWHEFLSAESTLAAPTDPRPFASFLADVTAAPAFKFRDYNAFGQLTQ